VIFADTSALYASINDQESHHAAARSILSGLIESGETIVTTNYVVVEFLALSQHRFGMGAIKALINDVIPEMHVAYIDQALHEAALDLFLQEGRRQLSLVDCTSIAFMRRARLRQAFAFDTDFARFGIELLAQG
jgi:predicted nucleic acid-binding protein